MTRLKSLQKSSTKKKKGNIFVLSLEDPNSSDVGQSSEDEYECTNKVTDTHLELPLVGYMDQEWDSIGNFGRRGVWFRTGSCPGTIQKLQESTVYFDNFFNTLDLIVFLQHEYVLSSLGTIRSNRLKGILEADKNLMKRGCGSMDNRRDNIGVAAVEWADSKCVKLASSCSADSALFYLKRYA
ncbi:hypothetical protein HHI36_012901 [Cryptolaemus montrouzieri]|uniref:PiggyBac transposable element-derived protein domain-containing protein n=1 Tax=Cryptolaemus montrouzieri TaxID=559131 RepID=A0ABD2NGP3_9CUCU